MGAREKRTRGRGSGGRVDGGVVLSGGRGGGRGVVGWGSGGRGDGRMMGESWGSSEEVEGEGVGE